MVTRQTMVCNLWTDSSRFNIKIHHKLLLVQHFTIEIPQFLRFYVVKYLCWLTRRCRSDPVWCLSCGFSPGSCCPFSSAHTVFFSPLSHLVCGSCSQWWHKHTRPTRWTAEGNSFAEEREADDGTLESGGLALPSSSDVMWSSGKKI